LLAWRIHAEDDHEPGQLEQQVGLEDAVVAEEPDVLVLGELVN
jgi:hypothetical protein